MATKKTDGAGGARNTTGAKAPGKTPKSGAAETQAGRAGTGKAAAAKKAAGAGAGRAGAKAPARKVAGAGGAATKTGGARAGGAKTGDLRGDLRDFASGRPQGWNHDEWLGFLEDLRQRGHDVEDRDAVGGMLERERLNVLLEKVPGMGAGRVRAVGDRFGSVWRLKDASADEIAREAKLPRPLAEKIREALP